MPQVANSLRHLSFHGKRTRLESVAIRANRLVGDRLSGDDRVNRRVLREASQSSEQRAQLIALYHRRERVLGGCFDALNRVVAEHAHDV